MNPSKTIGSNFQYRRRYRRVASILAAAAFLWVATLATLHTLTHALNGPEPVCSVCLAADHAGHGLATVPVVDCAFTRDVVIARFPTHVFQPVFTAAYLSRAPPALPSA